MVSLVDIKILKMEATHPRYLSECPEQYRVGSKDTAVCNVLAMSVNRAPCACAFVVALVCPVSLFFFFQDLFPT